MEIANTSEFWNASIMQNGQAGSTNEPSGLIGYVGQSSFYLTGRHNQVATIYEYAFQHSKEVMPSCYLYTSSNNILDQLQHSSGS
jgi:hypothetical protein